MSRSIVASLCIAAFLSFSQDITFCQWVHMPGPADSGGMHCVCVQGKYLFVGTSNGLYRSDDDGATWKTLDTTFQYGTDCLLSDDTVIYASSSRWLFRSRDNGSSWDSIYQSRSDLSISALGRHNGNIFVSSDSIQRTGDGGATWVTAAKNIDTHVAGFTTIGNDIYACGYHGIFRSTNEGTMWYFINPPYQKRAIEAAAVVSIGTILIASSKYFDCLYRTGNYGQTWSTVDSGSTQAPVNSFAVSGNNIFAGRSSNAAVTFSPDKGLHWYPRIEGLGDSDVRALAAGTKYLFAGTWNAGLWRSDLASISAVNTETNKSGFDFEIFPNPSRKVPVLLIPYTKNLMLLLRCLTCLDGMS